MLRKECGVKYGKFTRANASLKIRRIGLAFVHGVGSTHPPPMNCFRPGSSGCAETPDGRFHRAALLGGASANSPRSPRRCHPSGTRRCRFLAEFRANFARILSDEPHSISTCFSRNEAGRCPAFQSCCQGEYRLISTFDLALRRHGKRCRPDLLERRKLLGLRRLRGAHFLLRNVEYSMSGRNIRDL